MSCGPGDDPNDAEGSALPQRLTNRAWAQLGTFCGWWGLAFAIMMLDADDAHRSVGHRFAFATVWALAGVGVTSGGWFLTRRWRMLARPPLQLLLWVAFVAVIGCAAWVLAFVLVEAVAFPSAEQPDATVGDVVSTFVFCAILLTAWQALAIAVYQTHASQRERERAMIAETLARDARLLALRTQLSPHFLFNALNSVVALIAERPDAAQRMLTDISTLLRTALQPDSEEATLGDEIAFVENLIKVQQARFEENLRVEISVDGAILDTPFPALLLQPLVENAIKHGMNTCKPPLDVSIVVGHDGDVVHVVVSNTGSLQSRPLLGVSDACGGVGLQNVRERLNALFPERHSLLLYERNGYVFAELRLELQP